MKILQVNTADIGGGAEMVAHDLLDAYRGRGQTAWLAVGVKQSQRSDVLEIPIHGYGGTAKTPLNSVREMLRRKRGRVPGAGPVERFLGRLSNRNRLQDWWHGREEFQFPGSRALLQLPPEAPDIVHCHNLHGWYFDLRFLPELSHRVPVVLTLHDAWLLTGHCAFFRDCPRWKEGCGQCPHLHAYPAIRRDASRENQQRKRDILRASRIFVSSPARWLIDCARQAGVAAEQYKVIPNGVDLNTFRPGEQREARRRLNLPERARIVLFVASSRKNLYKDFPTLEQAMDLVAERGKVPGLLLVCLGGGETAVTSGKTRNVPFVKNDPGAVACYYRACDIYAHAAHAETSPRSIIEAMACGKPVVATDVGGVGELVQDGETGWLVDEGDARGMAEKIERVLVDDTMCSDMSDAAARRGKVYDLDRQVDAYLNWYQEIVKRARAR